MIASGIVEITLFRAIVRSTITLVMITLPFVPLEAVSLDEESYAAARKEARERKRRLVFHSDGVAMDPDKKYLEPNKCVLPYLQDTQTDACTYSLIHQFPVTRLYRSKVGFEHPPGIIEKLYGNGPDGLDEYINYCHQNGYEAFWAMRTNDTHDSGNSDHGRRRLKSNTWKLQNRNLLVGDPENIPPFAGWTAFDYSKPEVREKVFLILEEVCKNYDIDGIVLDFFRHLPTFKSTAWGGQASEEERQMLTSLLVRVRKMLDEIGMARGRPILLSVRTPDGLEYCHDLGFATEDWMEQGLIDIWIATGYFRLQEWEKTVEIGHRHGVQVWASMDESRVAGRDNRNSLEAYRARIMNAWRAGVDAVWIFNFFYYPEDPQFQLLFEAGDLATLAFKDKVYVADGRGISHLKYYLKGGERYISRPTYFSPQYTQALKAGASEKVHIQVGDDLSAADSNGYTPLVKVRIQTDSKDDSGLKDVQLNGHDLKEASTENAWHIFTVNPSIVECGSNEVIISGKQESKREVILKDLQLSIDFQRQ